MGWIKDLFGKNKENEQPEVPAKKEDSSSKAKKGRERRYSFLAEDVFETSRMQGVFVVGTIHGKIREGDIVYVYQPKKPVKEFHVLAIELKPREVAEMAKNERVALCLDAESVDEISKYAVLSSVNAQEIEKATGSVENPRLFGLMMEYARLFENSGYMDSLLYELCQARFVLPLYMDRPPMPNPDGTLSFGEDAKVGFRSIKKWDDTEKTVFPVFTDWGALWYWKDAFYEGQPKQTVTLRLPEVLSFVKKGHAGLVVNPFGPVPVYFPIELLEKVEESEPYKEILLAK
ncbi:MAG: SseB family protein [Lachnospiraceae bacterium]|nr:SseB family protein [Lachnospiraceae bacterium]